MDDLTLREFRCRLEAERQQILRAQAQLSHELQIPQEDFADDVDLTSSQMEQALRIRLKGREGAYLKKIEGALSRIRSGTFGLCMECEEPIEAKRLEIRPTTNSCIRCKEEQERSERNFAEPTRIA